MADINFKMKSDFAQASKDLKNFGTITEAETKRVKKFQESFKGESVDKFIDKNKRLGAAYKANKGDVSAIIAQQKALEKQSISLIKKGLDPQDKAIEELNKEYNRLQKEYDKTIAKTKAMEDSTKLASKALVGIGAAVALAGAAILTSTIDLAQAGDELAKTSRKVGVGTDALQELSFAAERVGLPANNLSGLFQKLNRNIGDLQAGTGTLTTFLNKSDTALKAQLETTTDSEEAFNILIDAIAKAPTQFDKAALSQAAFGRAGQDLILFANEGTEGIEKLREEARKYGLISEEVAQKSEDFVDSQRNLKQATIGVRSELAGKLLPAMTDTLNKIAAFISEGDNLQKVFNTIKLVIIPVTAGLITFTAAAKGALIISKLKNVIIALKIVLASTSGVIGLTVLAITALTGITLSLINAQTGLIDKYKESKRITDAFANGTETLNDKLAVSQRQVAENSVEIDTLTDMYERATDPKFKKKWQDQLVVLLEQNQVARRIESSIRLEIKAKQDKIALENEEIRLIAEKKQKEDEAAATKIKQYVDQNKAVEAILEKSKSEIELIDDKIAGITEFALTDSVFRDNQLKAIEVLEGQKKKILDKEVESNQKSLDDKLLATEEMNRTLMDNLLQQSGNRLDILEAEKQKSIEEAEAVGADTTLLFKFYENEKTKILNEESTKRKEKEIADIEAVRTKYADYAGQVTGIVNDLFTVQTNNTETDKQNKINALDRKLLGEEGYAEAVTQIEKDIAIDQWKIQKEQLAFQKAASLIEIAINTAVGISKAFAQGGTLGFVTGALVGAAGAAQAAVVLSQPSVPKPTAQTGTPMGGIEIPSSSSTRQDNVAVFAQPGERVDVSPRGQKSSQRFTIEIGKKVILDIVNDGITDGDVRITDDNIQKVG